MINEAHIKQFNPCKNRFDNYLKYYSGKSHTRRQFMGLKNITHEDKLWVAFRSMPKDKVRLAAADIAELVLPIFEKARPGDLRPRRAIEAARCGDKNAASYAAAAYADAYYADALAAANAARAAYYAADAANYAAANAANYANRASLSAGQGSLEKRIRTIVLKYWKTEERG